MSGLFRLTGLVFVLCLSSVTGIRFDKTSNDVDLGADSQDQPNFWLNCTVESLSNDVNTLYLIKIQRASSDGHTWETIATLTSTTGAEHESSAPSYWRNQELLQGFLYTNESRLQSYLNVGVRVSDLTCVDSRMYNCEVGYLKTNPVVPVTESVNTSLTMTAQSSVPSLAAMHVNTGAVLDTNSNSENLPASLAKYQTLEITCTADIGTDNSRSLQWAKSSEGFGDAMIGYSTDVVEEEPTPITSGGAATSCRYQRISRMRYNTTDYDATRGSNNELRFSCTVSSSQNSVMFYVDVTGGSGGNTDTTVNNAGSSSAGAIAGGLVGGLVAIVIVAVLVYFFWYRRRSTGDDYKTKEEYGSENPNMAPTNNELYATPNKPKGRRGHENRGLDEPHESKPRRNDYNSRGGGGRANFGMQDDDDGYNNHGDYDSRDGSPTLTDQGIGHMGVDPINGSIGTGV